MSDMPLPAGQRTKKKGGNIVPALCNIAGILIILFVIATCLLMIMPRFMGYEIYNVISGSMEPEIPVGSVIYVEHAEPSKIENEEIIAFENEGAVIVHRVVENHVVEGTFTTKGDANEQEDMNDVGYDAFIGRVKYHYPMLGILMEIYSTPVGKGYAVCFAACGAMLNILAARIRERRRR